MRRGSGGAGAGTDLSGYENMIDYWAGQFINAPDEDTQMMIMNNFDKDMQEAIQARARVLMAQRSSSEPSSDGTSGEPVGAGFLQSILDWGGRNTSSSKGFGVNPDLWKHIVGPGLGGHEPTSTPIPLLQNPITVGPSTLGDDYLHVGWRGLTP